MQQKINLIKDANILNFFNKDFLTLIDSCLIITISILINKYIRINCFN
jgi:hypothetical protein